MCFDQALAASVMQQVGQVGLPSLSSLGFKGLILALPFLIGLQNFNRQLQRGRGRFMLGCWWLKVPNFPQWTYFFQQNVGAGANLIQHDALQFKWQGVEPLAPVVSYQLLQQCIWVVQMGLLKQVSAHQGKTAEHASAPAMDGVDGSFVHGLCGQMQTTRTLGPKVFGHVLAETLQKRIVWR